MQTVTDTDTATDGIVRQDATVTITIKTVVASPTLDIYRYQITKYHGPYQTVTSEYRVGKRSLNYMSSDAHPTVKGAYRQWIAMTTVMDKMEV